MAEGDCAWANDGDWTIGGVGITTYCRLFRCIYWRHKNKYNHGILPKRGSLKLYKKVKQQNV